MSTPGSSSQQPDLPGRVITPMSEADLEDVIGLALQTPEIQDQAGEAEFFSKATLAAWLTSPTDPLFVAHDEEGLAGFVIASFHPLARIGYVYDLVVAPRARGHGTGPALVQAVMQRFAEQQAREIWCLVHEHNPAASRLFQRFGLQKGRRFDLHIWLADQEPGKGLANQDRNVKI